MALCGAALYVILIQGRRLRLESTVVVSRELVRRLLTRVRVLMIDRRLVLVGHTLLRRGMSHTEVVVNLDVANCIVVFLEDAVALISGANLDIQGVVVDWHVAYVHIFESMLGLSFGFGLLLFRVATRIDRHCMFRRTLRTWSLSSSACRRL